MVCINIRRTFKLIGLYTVLPRCQRVALIQNEMGLAQIGMFSANPALVSCAKINVLWLWCSY